MRTTELIAKHLREVCFGGNWTWSNLRDNLQDLGWEQASTKVHQLNTIAVLVYHIQYYFDAITRVLEHKPIEAHDRFSFDCPPIRSEADWQLLVQQAFDKAERLAQLIEAFPDTQLHDTFVEPKYGNYYRNFHGLIEHTHYHLGQIAVIKKIIKTG